jgi:aspartyl aminopeptidase
MVINSVWSKQELPDQRKKSTVVPIYKAITLTAVIIVGHHYFQLHTYMELLGIISVGFDVTVIHAFVRRFKKIYDSVRRTVL